MSRCHVAVGVLARATLAGLICLAGVPAAAKTTEFGAVPLVGGDSDNGFGFGGIASVAAPDPQRPPYRWSLEAGGFITFDTRDDRPASPYQDLYLRWVAPRLGGGRLWAEARGSWTRENALDYYGIGNASVRPADSDSDRDAYARRHPEVYLRVRLRLWGPWALALGQTFAHNGLAIPSRSFVARDLRAPPEGFAAAFRTVGDHGVARSEAGVVFDTRDTELSPTMGQFHVLRARVSPRLGEALPYGYQQLNLTLRGYRALGAPTRVLAGRLVGDVLFGDAPFYELTRFDDTNAVGGPKGVRGVPAQRFYGKVKLFSNLELRALLLRFRLAGKAFSLGSVTFFDVGRVWSDLSPSRALDGTGLGLHYGLGAGLRLTQGSTFVVRADLAWSPDARPLGAYVSAGQVF